jgi:hypothetical protein
LLAGGETGIGLGKKEAIDPDRVAARRSSIAIFRKIVQSLPFPPLTLLPL